MLAIRDICEQCFLTAAIQNIKMWLLFVLYDSLPLATAKPRLCYLTGVINTLGLMLKLDSSPYKSQ